MEETSGNTFVQIEEKFLSELMLEGKFNLSSLLSS